MTIALIVMFSIAAAIGGWALGYWQGGAATRRDILERRGN